MSTPKRIAAFLSHYHGRAVLEALLTLRPNAEVVLLATDNPENNVCNPQRRLWRHGWTEKLRSLVSERGAGLGLCAHTESVKTTAFWNVFSKADPDVVVSCVFGQRLPQTLLEYVNGQAFNNHPVVPHKPLSFTAGIMPIERALATGASAIQVAVHQMTRNFDDGRELARSRPMRLQQVNQPTAFDYLEIIERTAPLSAELVREYLPHHVKAPESE